MAAEAVCKYGARAFVTGANRGIGLELCRLLTEAGCEVYAAVRKESEALSKVGVHKVITGVDVSNATSLEGLAASLGEGVKLDLVINNAGVLERDSFESLNAAAIQKQFTVNSLGPLLVLKALEGSINDGAKIANISSRMGSVGDCDSGSMYGYRMSKSALNMASKCLAIDLRPRNIAVACLHPGWVQTDMGGAGAAVTPADSAAGLLDRIEGLNMENSGTFWHMNGEVLPW